MKKILLILMVGSLFGDTITYNQGNNKQKIENVKFTRAGNGKVYFKAHGEETSRYCNRIIEFTDDDGNPIEYDCNAVLIEESLNELESKIESSITEKDMKIIISKNKKTHIFRERWSYSEPKDPFKSGMLSAIIPSGGHFYNEEYYKGVKYLFGVPILYSVGLLIALNNIENNDDAGVFAGRLVQFSALFLHFYNVYDAIISSNNINKAYYDEYLENQQKKADSN